MGTSVLRAMLAHIRTILVALAALALTLILAPSALFADDSVGAGLAPAHIEGSGEAATPNSVLQGGGDGFILASALTDTAATIVSADVMLDAAEPVVDSFTVDGLTYSINSDSLTLVAVDSAAVSDGILAIPGTVTYNGMTYPVIAIAPYAFYLSGVTQVELPASITSVDDRAFRSSDVERVDVAADNPDYASFDGALYSADKSCLLLIPEGRAGAVLLPQQAEVVQASEFSHCSLVDAISVEGGGANFASWDGLLYDVSGTTLLRVPAGATEITIRDGCTTIAAGALEGCANLECINAPATVTSISPDVFTSIPTISLPATAIAGSPGSTEVETQMIPQDGANSGVASALADQSNASADSIPQLTAMVALSTTEDDLFDIDPSSITVSLIEGADAALWESAGFTVASNTGSMKLDSETASIDAATALAAGQTTKILSSGSPGLQVSEYWSSGNGTSSFTQETLDKLIFKTTYSGSVTTAYGTYRAMFVSAQRAFIVKKLDAGNGPWHYDSGWDMWCLSADFKSTGDGLVDRVEASQHSFEDMYDKWIDIAEGESFILYNDYPRSSNNHGSTANQPLRIIKAGQPGMQVSEYWCSSASSPLTAAGKFVYKESATSLVCAHASSRVMYVSSQRILVFKDVGSGDDPWTYKGSWDAFALSDEFASTLDGGVSRVEGTYHSFADMRDKWIDLVPGERFTLYSAYDLGFDVNSEPGDEDYPGEAKPDQTVDIDAGQVLIEDPKRPGYVFQGWAIPNAEGTEAVDQELVHQDEDGKWYVDASKLPDYAGDDGRVELTARWTSVISVDVPQSVTFYADTVTQGQQSREGAASSAFGQSKVANQSKVDLRVVGLESSAVETTDTTLGADSILKKADAATPSTSASKLLSLYPSTKQWTAEELQDPEAVGGSKDAAAVDFDLDDILLEKSFSADAFTIEAGKTLNMGYRLNLTEAGQQLDYDKLSTLEEGQSAAIANVSYCFAADYGPVFWTTDDDGSTLGLAAIKADAEKIAAGDAATIEKYTRWMSDDHRFYVKWYDQGKTEAQDPDAATVYEVRIIGINHDDKSDGSGKAGLTFQLVNGLNDFYPMSASKTNAGGWGASDMRQNLNGGIVWKQLPTAFKHQLVQVDKGYFDGPLNLSATLKTSSDFLFLISFRELSARDFPSGWDKLADEGTLYDWWRLKDIAARSDNAAACKGTQSDPTVPRSWYQRSAYPTVSFNYVYTNTPGQTWDGFYSGFNAGLYMLVSPCFCL